MKPGNWYRQNGGLLQGGRRARRSGARNCRKYGNDQGRNFEPIHDRCNGNARRLGRDYGSHGGTSGAEVRGRRIGRQIGTKVKLRREEENPDEQNQDASTICPDGHVLTKTELRAVWLRGQGNRAVP